MREMVEVHKNADKVEERYDLFSGFFVCNTGRTGR